MNEKTKSFLVSLAVGAVITLAVCLMTKTESIGIIQCLCDGLFVAGVLVAGSGGLVFVRNQGMFDIFTFGVRSLFGVHFPWVDPRDKQRESYAEYRERKRKNRKSPVGTVLAGVVFLALSGIMLAIYYL